MEPTTPKVKEIKALLCQIKPVFKQKKQNLERIKKSLERYTSKDGFDIVMFPEMAFIGYNFRDPEHIMEETEELGNGESYAFCVELARKLRSYVIFGYAEKKKQGKEVVLYNSACLINREGDLVTNAHKSHLYESDQLWAKEGEGFRQVTIKNLNGQEFKCIIGICMDINPYKWTSGKFELAHFAEKTKSQVILFLSAWNDHQPNKEDENRSQIGIIEYWISRLRPLISTKLQTRPPILFLCCDRAGTQSIFTKKQPQQTTFIGTSCAFKLNPNELIMKLDKKNQGYLVVQTYLPK